MSYFATFSRVADDTRTAVRLADDGRATLLITGYRGEIMHSVEGRIDALEAADIVADTMLVAPELPNTGGELSVGVGDGEGAPELRSFHRSEMSPAAYDLEQRMQAVVEQLRGQTPKPEYDRPAPRRTVEMSAGSFMMWTGAFLAGHFAAAILGLIALGVLVKGLGFVGLIAAIPVMLILVGAPYFVIGMKMGARYGGHADAWKPAMLAVVLPSLISALAGGGFSSIGLAFLYPLIARAGARSAS